MGGSWPRRPCDLGCRARARSRAGARCPAREPSSARARSAAPGLRRAPAAAGRSRGMEFDRWDAGGREGTPAGRAAPGRIPSRIVGYARRPVKRSLAACASRAVWQIGGVGERSAHASHRRRPESPIDEDERRSTRWADWRRSSSHVDPRSPAAAPSSGRPPERARIWCGSRAGLGSGAPRRPDVALVADRFRCHLINAPGCGDEPRRRRPIATHRPGRRCLLRGRVCGHRPRSDRRSWAHSWGGTLAVLFAAAHWARPPADRNRRVVRLAARRPGRGGGGGAGQRSTVSVTARGSPTRWRTRARSTRSRRRTLRHGSAGAGPSTSRTRSPQLRDRTSIGSAGEDRYNMEAARYYDDEAVDLRPSPREGPLSDPRRVRRARLQLRPAWNRPIADGIDGAEIRVVADAGHCPQYEAPDEFRSMLFDWMARAEAGDRLPPSLTRKPCRPCAKPGWTNGTRIPPCTVGPCRDREPVATMAATDGAVKGEGTCARRRICQSDSSHIILRLPRRRRARVSQLTAQRVGAPPADGGWTLRSGRSPHAKAVLVGRIGDPNGEHGDRCRRGTNRVERANGIRIGSTYRGRVLAGLCSDDFPRVGAHVVMLLGVGFQPGDEGINVFYTIGRTVTASQAAEIRKAA